MKEEELLLFGDSRVPVFLTLAILALFLSTWLVTSWNARRAISLAEVSPPGLKRPPTLPYAIPFVGHLIQFLWDRGSFLSNAAICYGRAVPVQIIIPIFSNYILSGPENVTAYFKESRDFSSTTRAKNIMKNAFGCPSHLVHLFDQQTASSRPESKSPGRPEGFVSSFIHRVLTTGLSGTQLDALTNRFQQYLVERIEASANEIGPDWVALPDLTSFAEVILFGASMRSTFGTGIFCVNPALAEDFSNFDRSVGTLFMGLPRWLNPAAHKARDKMVKNFERWQKYAREHCDIFNLDDVDWDPYYGTKYNQERQKFLTKRGIMDETARAAENFAFAWAANANSIIASTWFLLETLLDPTLEKRVCARLPAASLIPSSDSSSPKRSIPVFDAVKLCSDPLLQSIYAETLRFCVGVLLVREPTRDNYSFRGWSIKKTEILTISTRTEAMNPEIWGTGGDGNPHPLDTFWADRFIVDPADPNSGPLRKPKGRNQNSKVNGVISQSNQAVNSANNNDDNDHDDNTRKPYFSMEGLSASWIPYGGGQSHCPGRHFAKRQMILSTAIFLTAFDIELIEEEGKKRPNVDMSCFGFGAMPPDRKIPFRIRRRAA